MDEYREYEEMLCGLLRKEMKSLKERPHSSTLQGINELLKAVKGVRCLQADEGEMMYSEQGHKYSGAGYATPKKLTEQQYKEWMRDLVNADGSTGPHWTIEQTQQVQNQKGLTQYDKHAFWAAMNASYSDLCTLFKKHGMDTADAYAEYAVDFWFEDEDAVGGGNGDAEKLAAYYTAVVEK